MSVVNTGFGPSYRVRVPRSTRTWIHLPVPFVSQGGFGRFSTNVASARSMKIPGHHFPGSGFAFLQDDLWAFESSGSVAASTSVVHRFDRKSGETFEETTVPVHVAAAAPMTCAPGTAK